MRLFLISLLVGLFSIQASSKEAVYLADDPVVEQRLISISEELRCLVCQNESLAGSRAELADDLRREVRGMIKQGRSDEEIKDFLVSRYGDFVLYRPPVKPSTWFLWVGPFVFIILGIWALIVFLKNRQKAVLLSLSKEDQDKVDALLRDVRND